MISTFEKHKELLADETKAYAFLATLMPDGSPQVTPVWFNTDGEHILVNSAKGRVKDKNMRARPQVAVTIMNLDDAYDYAAVRGQVVEITEEGAREHINALSKKYRGKDVYGGPEGETRVIYKIKPN
ncbi:MAG: PPOX class F420-dependent oxidoreductase [Chloroflexi bacterium]|nr:MAG: PPOX class F420-dependent oxidoreductase [Chloroflexota bacterium]MBL1195961.1 PPOX class F420-dependent oxidoreductase [Chloroflexota bacterium]NOH13255.1 PPOX class F420-dependent oxidoreductase [Chloroflexota bacterium]